MTKLLISLDAKRERILRKAAEDLQVSVSEFVRRLLDEHVVFSEDAVTDIKSTIRRRSDYDR